MFSEHRNTEIVTESSPPRPEALEKLFNILNRGDRFNLLDNPTVQAGNLQNNIHPIFHHSHFLGLTENFKQALQLASLYLTTHSLLDFYLPLTFGVTEKDNDDGRTYKFYQGSDREYELECIEAAMICLSHSLTWDWTIFEPKHVWGRTKQRKGVPTQHIQGECPVYDTGSDENPMYYFTKNTQCLVELNKDILDFYLDEKDGYATRSRCEQFRHDFQLALVLGHEIAHAYSTMANGTMREPWLARDHPRNEHGFAWENFMFGTLINPPKKTTTGEYIQMHSVWKNKDVLRKYWGHEWTAIPVAWTAQWFRTETWDEVERAGHRAVALPEPKLKVWLSYGLDKHVVYTDDEDARADLEWARDSAALSFLFSKGGFDDIPSKQVSRAAWMPMCDLAKESFVPTPQRHFDEALVDDQQYLKNAQNRDHNVWKALKAVKNTLTNANMTSIAAGIKVSSKHTGRLRPRRVLKKISVAARPMTSSSGESSPEFPDKISGIPKEDFYSRKYIGLRPEFYQAPPARSHSKRSRESEVQDSFVPSKKARRVY
jgi:hypothetical protein